MHNDDDDTGWGLIVLYNQGQLGLGWSYLGGETIRKSAAYGRMAVLNLALLCPLKLAIMALTMEDNTAMKTNCFY